LALIKHVVDTFILVFMENTEVDTYNIKQRLVFEELDSPSCSKKSVRAKRKIIQI
jgi:hypothetical protein